MSENTRHNRLSSIYYCFQIAFVIIISLTTIYNLCLTRKQSKLVFKPFIGVVDANITKIIDGSDTYDNTKGVLLRFNLENVGNLPAKNVKILTVGKIGNTILPRTEADEKEGITLAPHMKVTNSANFGRDVLVRLVEKGERLVFSVQLSYSDLEDYELQDYTSYYEIAVVKKDPLALALNIIPKIK